MSSSRQSNAVAASNKLKFKGKSTIMKELQRTASFWAYNTVHTSGNSKAQNAIEELVAKRYFGDPSDKDSMGYAEQLVNGLNAFASMYDPQFEVEELTATAPGGGTGLRRLTMRSQFHCSSDLIVCSQNPNDEGINMAVLSSKALSNRGQLSPNNIFKNAKLVEQNGRKALALVQRSEFKDGKMPSGKNYQDYLLFLRETMYKELVCTTGLDECTGKKGNADDGSTASDHGNNPPATDSNMKDDWFFPGFISFALWGPITPDDSGLEYKAEAFFSGDDIGGNNGGGGNDNKSRKAAGRAKLRAAELLHEHPYSTAPSTTSRQRGGENKAFTPALANKDVLFAAYIAQQESSTGLKQKNQQRKLMLHHHNSKIKHCQKELKTWRSLLTPSVLSSECPNSQYIMREFQEAKDNLRSAVRQLDAFVSEKISSNPAEEEGASSSVYMKLVRDTLTKTLGSASSPIEVNDGTSLTATSSTGSSSTAGGTKRQRLLLSTISSIEIPVDEWNTGTSPLLDEE